MQHLIEVDNLTGANNLKAFTTLSSSLINAYTNKKYVIIYFDIDRFTLINEKQGYTSGDYILKEITNILRERLNPHETFCRIVDDKFVVLSEYTTLEDFQNRLIDFKQKVYNICDENDNYLKIHTSAGMSYIDTADNISQIIDEANTARRSIKNKHNIRYAFFNESMRSNQLKQKSLEDVMEDALKNEEFCLYLQPKYDIEKQKVCGAEALVRWNRPGYGLVPPDEFIPIFEENSFIIDIDYYIFDKVCELTRSLLDQGKTPVPISVNFSRLHLNNTKILTKLKENLEKYNLTPEYIEIEITESALADNDSYMYSILNEIHRMGFKLAMDDFGTGLSSLNSLRKLPFDILKLDKDFFQKNHITNREQIVIRNIVRLGKELSMTIVSEGIETIEQINFLKGIKCPIIQGYFFSKPLPHSEFLAKYF
jgi:diguanylate cyclase (GGDEF)-like protein